MKTLMIKPKELKLASLKNKRPSRKDFSRLITEDCVIKVPGHFRILYKRMDFDSVETIKALKSINFSTHTRTGGLKTRSELIGFKPRNARRIDACEISALATKHHKQHEHFLGLAQMLAKVFKECLRPYFQINEVLLKRKKILDNYKIAGTPFTSGIINYNNPLGYHIDRGNIPNMLSCMLVLKNSVTGGYLSLPQLDIGIELQDKTILIFDGQNLIHGVTPISYADKYAYRYSFVFYSMYGMWNCLESDKELERYQKILDTKSK